MATFEVTVVKREVYVLEISTYTEAEAKAIAEGTVERGNVTPGLVTVDATEVRMISKPIVLEVAG
jgi:hypothetical protein